MGAYRRSARWGAPLVAACLIGSCAGQKPDLGGLMLAIGQDGPLPINRIDIEVEYAGQTLRRSSFRVPEEAQLPTTLAIASNGDATAGVKIAVVGWNDDLPLDRRDAIVTQVPSDRVARLDIVLSGRCSKRVMLEADGTARSTCGEGRTCAPETGDCTDASIEAKSLPSYEAGDEEQLGVGGSDGLGNGGAGATSGSSGSKATGGDGQGGDAPTSLGGMGGSDAPLGMAGAGGVPEPSVCGDGVVGAAEACDDGNQDFADGCTGNCQQIEAQYSCDVSTNICSPAAVCGNGVLETPFEECDDGNAQDKDGCSATCQRGPGVSCPRPGKLCLTYVGDKIVAGAEACDDGGKMNGDGCSAAGQLEPGYYCPTPGTACAKTICGDAKAEGLEACDDGNLESTDGCTSNCVLTPSCPAAGGACTSVCGDGIVAAAEECDDGNKRPGDGCTAACKKEAGYDCEPSVSAIPSSLSITYRDFISAPTAGNTKHADFEAFNSGLKTGIVQSTLSAAGDPVFTGTCDVPPCPITSAVTFSQWFQDVPGVNLTSSASVALLNDVNGTRFFDSSAFFPLDGKGFVASLKETATSGHNFGFTTEMRFWFNYQGGETIAFSGDDDVWLFVAGKLAIDLGGVHGQMSGSVALDSLVLTPGQAYEVAIFQAERHITASNYKLTIKGFVTTKSVCATVCGDAFVTPNEECDRGNANGSGYGKCGSACTLNAGCGDGVKQPQEECDAGAPLVYGGCASDCTERVCGDGRVQAGFEECDDSNVEPGDGCSATCQVE